MAQEASIVFKAYDQITGSMKSMGEQSRGLSKEWELQQNQLRQLGDRYKDFNKRSAEAKASAMETKKAMDEARKAFKATGTEADKTNFTHLQEQYQELTDQAKAYQEAAAQTRKAMRDTADTARRTDQGGLMSALGQAGAFSAVGQVAGQWANTMAGSLLGNTGGTLAGGALSGAGMGAAIGSMIAPGIGTAVGAALGGIVGMIGAGAQVYEKRDDAFKSYVQESVQHEMNRWDSDVQSGSSIAAGRETDRISLKTMFGSMEAADTYLDKMVTMANDTPFLYNDLMGMTKVLGSYGYDDSNILPVLQAIGDTGAAKGWTSADMGMVATALGRMKSSDKASLEYLNMLNDRGVNAVGMLADARGIDQGTMYDLISKGEVSGREAVDIILQSMVESFSGSMLEQSKTYAGLMSTVEGLNQELQNAAGEAYNEERKTGKGGLEDERDWLSGEQGAALSAAYANMGQYQAFLENTKKQYEIDAINAVMETRAYQEAAKAGSPEAGRMIAEARIQAQNEYNANEGKDALINGELSLLESVRADTSVHDGYWELGYLRSEAYSEGLARGMVDNVPEEMRRPRPVGMANYENLVKPHAAGLNRVPFDNYPALLHQGERVLTAAEARAMGSGGGDGITINVSGMTVREDADIQRIAQALADELELRALARGG